jgi:hypothetical protein
MGFPIETSTDLMTWTEVRLVLAEQESNSLASPSTPATRNGDNDRDNVEQVVVDAPTAGAEYIIRVTHKGTLVDDNGQPSGQTLSIILSGNEAETPPDFQVRQLQQTGSTDFTLDWNAVVGGVYQIETSTDLFDYTTVTGEISATKVAPTLTVDGTSAANRRFWRVKRLR